MKQEIKAFSKNKLPDANRWIIVDIYNYGLVVGEYYPDRDLFSTGAEVWTWAHVKSWCYENDLTFTVQGEA